MNGRHHSLEIQSSLEVQLREARAAQARAEQARDAAERSRDVAEQRAVRAESEARVLRQQLAVFGEKMLSAAHGTTPGEAQARTFELPRPEALPSDGSSDRNRDETGSQQSPSEQRGAKRTRRVWIFNTKWMQGREWLEYDKVNETMGCSVCRMAGESGKWARRGITRLRLEAITSHANDQKHQRHLNDATEAIKRAELGAQHNVQIHQLSPTAHLDMTPAAQHTVPAISDDSVTPNI